MRSVVRRLLPFLFIGLSNFFAAVRFGKAEDVPCRFVALPSENRKFGAEAIAGKLAGVGSGISIKAVTSDSLLVCAGSTAIDGAVAAVKAAAGVKEEALKSAPETHYARLYFNRNASAIADAISDAYPNVGVKALGQDLLIFKGKDRADETSIHELKRWIASLDTPRPEITLNAWSVQVSAPTQEDITRISRAVRENVTAYNEQLQRALQRGWNYLSAKHNNRDFPKPYFGAYVLQRYEADQDTYQKMYTQSPYAWCGKPTYCLGYGRTFTSSMQPTLNNFIGVLAAAKDKSVIDNFVNALEGKPLQEFGGKADQSSALPGNETSCESQDDTAYRTSKKIPAFYCFRRELQDSLITYPTRLALLRTAMADFLFQYKFSLQYPHQLEPFEYAASAQVLDTQLNPLLSAFNRDMTVYLRQLQEEILPLNDKQGHVFVLKSHKGDIKFLSNGIVTLRTTSGMESEVDSATQSAFPQTPPPLAQEFLKNLMNTEGKIPGLISANLAPQAAAALTAFLNSGQSSTVSLGRDLNLKVTPTSLQGASSVDLKVHLEAKDDGQPKRIGPDGTPQDDTTDRVVSHLTDTNIRVDSLGLFEISTLSAELSHAREPISLLPPFVDLPYIKSFLQYKPGPGTAYHRSFAILSATVLPTAADLLNGLRFEHDRLKGESIVSANNADQDQTAQGLREVHKAILYCIADEANPSGKSKQDLEDRAIKCNDLFKLPSVQEARR